MLIMNETDQSRLDTGLQQQGAYTSNIHLIQPLVKIEIAIGFRHEGGFRQMKLFAIAIYCCVDIGGGRRWGYLIEFKRNPGVKGKGPGSSIRILLMIQSDV